MPSKAAVGKLIKRRHPEYDSMLAHWRFMESCYVGGREWFKDNIFRYLKEGDGEYYDRVKRAYRFNHTREVVDLVDKYLFRAEISRNYEDAPAAVKEFWDNVNGKGLNIDEFMRVVSKQSSIFGCPWIIVDNRDRDIPENASKADETPNSIYAYIIKPEQACDWSWDDEGNLNWILVMEYKRDDEDPFESSGDINVRFRLWTKTDWYLIENVSPKNRRMERWEITEQGAHNLGVVPAIRADNMVSSEPWVTPALIADVAYLDRAVANYLSNLDAIIQDQTFSQLAMPAQNMLPGEESYQKLIEMGTKRIFLYDGEGGQGPAYLSPDPRQAQLIISAIQQIINEIYHSVGLAGERTKQDNAKGIDNSSGVAKSKDFERVNSLLIAKADALENIENQLVRLVARWAGDDRFAESEVELVVYPESFNVRGLYDEFDIAMQLALIEAPLEMRSEQMKLVMEKLFPSLSRDLRKRIEADIGRWHEEQKEKSAPMMQAEEAKVQMLEEAKRNREVAGAKQSATKTRQENRRKESDRATGQ